MEPYFNEICETYFLQKNSNEGYPSLSKLTALKLDVDELTEVAYRLVKEKRGANCVMEGEIMYKQKPI